MKRLYRKLAFNYSEGGLGGLSLKMLSFASYALYSRTAWHVYVHRFLDSDTSEHQIQYRELNFQDLLDARYAKAAAFPEEIRARFDRQNACYGFYLNDRLAVVGWSSDGYLELDHGVIFSCPCEAALFDFLTLPEFRGRGLYTNALRYLVRKLQKAGKHSVYIAVDPNNVHSVRGIEAAGFSRVLCISRRRILGFAFISRTPAQPHLLASAS
jgi:ribosomal protein S18 acetylase RimI-like enzyme